MSLAITIFLLCVAIAIYFAFKPSKVKEQKEETITTADEVVEVVSLEVEEPTVEAPKKNKRKYYRRKPSSKKPKATE